MELTSVEQQVLETLCQHAALTTRRLEKLCGPKSAWERLLSEKWLRPYETNYGQIIGLDREGRHELQARGRYVPYLHGPGAVLDRAYQNDAIAHLTQAGYTVVDRAMKRATGVGRQDAVTTDQVVYHVLRVPDEKLSVIQSHERLPIQYPGINAKYKPPTPGHPYLYASLSKGGLGLSQVRRLWKKHENDVTVWKSPLLLAVPDEVELRSFIRRIQNEKNMMLDKIQSENRHFRILRHDLFQLIILPGDQ